MWPAREARQAGYPRSVASLACGRLLHRARRRLVWRTTLLAALAASAPIAAGCGGDDEPASAGNGVDRAFVAEMLPHHRSAVAMAKVAQRRGKSAFVRQLADDIVRSQGEEIETLRSEDAELEAAGVEKTGLGTSGGGMSMGMDTAALETAEPFDRAFLQMMLPHHQEAIPMARAELERGEDPELKALAEQIIAEQEREIREMRAAL